MSWVRVSDDFYDHPKFADVTPLSIALWITGVAYCNRNRTDGRIHESVAGRLVDFDGLAYTVATIGDIGGVLEDDCSSLAVHDLLKIGLWHEDGHDCADCPQPGRRHYYIHDYLVYQPSALEVQRLAAVRTEVGKMGASARWADGKGHGKGHGKRHGKSSAADEEGEDDADGKGHGKRHGDGKGHGKGHGKRHGDGKGHGKGHGKRHGKIMPQPQDPLTTTTRDSSSALAVASPDPERADVDRLCRHLADRIEANGSKRPNITQGWRDAARRLLDLDGRTEQQVHAAIDWCQTDEFWQANILSMPKLREKYDQLRLKAASNGRPHHTPAGVDLDAAMRRAAARDAAATREAIE